MRGTLRPPYQEPVGWCEIEPDFEEFGDQLMFLS